MLLVELGAGNPDVQVLQLYPKRETSQFESGFPIGWDLGRTVSDAFLFGPAAAALKEHTGPFSLTGGHPPFGGNGFPTLALPHGGSSRCFPSGCRSSAPSVAPSWSAGAAPLEWEGLLRLERVLAAAGAAPLSAEGRLLRAVGRRSSPAGARCQRRGSPRVGRPLAKGRTRSASKGGLQRAKGWKGERGSRPALLPESR